MAIIECPSCQKKVSDRAPYCSGCAHAIAAEPTEARASGPQPPPPPSSAVKPHESRERGAKGILLDCKACDAKTSVSPARVRRFGPVLRVIGYVIVTPSVLGVAIAVLLFISTTRASMDLAPTATTSAQRAGVVIGAGVTYGAALFVALSSLVSGLIGWLLLMKRKVLRCIRCGFILDRA